MAGRLVTALLAAALTLGGVAAAAAQKRVALVIANGETAELVGSGQGAGMIKSLTTLLGQHGYKVVEGVNLPKADIEQRIAEFKTAAADAEVALFYYAGDVVQRAGRNHMIATGARLSDPFANYAISFNDVMDVMKGQKANIVLVDGGRVSPMASADAAIEPQGESATRSGFSKALPRKSFVISFANLPGKITRADAPGGHVFTAALLKNLQSADIDVMDVVGRIRKDVFVATRGAQVPWTAHELTGAVPFLGPPVRVASLPSEIPVPPPAIVPPPRESVPQPPRLSEQEERALRRKAAPAEEERKRLIAGVQEELKTVKQRHTCFKADLEEADVDSVQAAVDALNKRLKKEARRPIRLAAATNGDFEDFLEYLRGLNDGICPAPAPRNRFSKPKEAEEQPTRPGRAKPVGKAPRVVEVEEKPTRRAVRESSPAPRAPAREYSPPSRPSVGGGGSRDVFTPNR